MTNSTIKNCNLCGAEVIGPYCKTCAASQGKARQKSTSPSAVPGWIGLLLIVGGGLWLFPVDNTPNSSAPPTRQELIASQFSGYSGSHYGMQSAIKKVMNDPDSYEHVGTTYIDNGDTLTVTTVFRGKNAFGAIVLTSMTAVVDLQGNVIEIVSE